MGRIEGRAALHCARQGYNIRRNSVHPAFVDTPMVEAMIVRGRDPEKMRAILAGQVPLGRIGQAEEIAAGILFLASDDSSFMTGTEFVLDGGLTAGC